MSKKKQREIIKRLITLKVVIGIVGITLILFLVEMERIKDSIIKNQHSLIKMEEKAIFDRILSSTNTCKIN